MEEVVPSQTSQPWPFLLWFLFGRSPATRTREVCWLRWQMDFYFLKWKATSGGDDLCCVSVLDDCGSLTDWSPLDSSFIPLFTSLGDDGLLFSKTMKIDQLKTASAMSCNFSAVVEVAWKVLVVCDPAGGRVPEGKLQPRPNRGRFLVAMPHSPHCPMTCFMQAALQFVRTNCALSVSIKQVFLRARLWLLQRLIDPRQSTSLHPCEEHSAWVQELSELDALWEAASLISSWTTSFNSVISSTPWSTL